MATLEVDPNLYIHTSYYNDLFLLRTRVLVNGDNTEIRSIKEGKYEGPALNFCLSGSIISTKLHLVASIVSPILVRYGIYHVDTFYYEQSPLFHVVFSSESCLKNFILATEEVKSALESQLQILFSSELKSILESPQHLNVEIQSDLFLVSPNRQGAELHLVTEENCSDILACWKNSKLFDFISLYQEDGMHWCQLTCNDSYKLGTTCKGSHLYVTCWTVCNQGQDFWLTKCLLDRLIILPSEALDHLIFNVSKIKLYLCILDSLIFVLWKLCLSLDQLSKWAVIAWFNFDPSHKRFTERASDYHLTCNLTQVWFYQTPNC